MKTVVESAFPWLDEVRDWISLSLKYLFIYFLAALSPVETHRSFIVSVGSFTVLHGGMWNLAPQPRTVSPALEGDSLTTGPLRKSQGWYHFKHTVRRIPSNLSLKRHPGLNYKSPKNAT